MPWGVVAGAVIGGVASGVGASNAADAQASTSAAALAQNEKQAWRTQQNFAPYLTVGGGALAKLSNLYGITAPANDADHPSLSGFKNNIGGSGGGDFSGKSRFADFYKSPDYNFNLTEGLKGITASGAAGSGTDNGATRKAEIGYAGNLASGQYDSYRATLMNLAGMGQASAANQAVASQNAANANTGILTNQGNNAAASDLAFGQLGSSFANTAGSIYQRYGSSLFGPSANSNTSDLTINGGGVPSGGFASTVGATSGGF